jgi:hypothetical protein
VGIGVKVSRDESKAHRFLIQLQAKSPSPPETAKATSGVKLSEEATGLGVGHLLRTHEIIELLARKVAQL